MPSVYELEYEDGRKEGEFFASGLHHYVIDEKTFLQLSEIVAWCFDCKKTTFSEDLQPVATLEEDVRAMDEPDSERYHKILGRIASRHNAKGLAMWLKHRFENTLEWRRQRVSPASCLSCGKRHVFPFPEREWIAHPETHEKCRLCVIGISSMAGKHRYYDVEGNFQTLSNDEYAAVQICHRAWEEQQLKDNPLPQNR